MKKALLALLIGFFLLQPAHAADSQAAPKNEVVILHTQILTLKMGILLNIMKHLEPRLPEYKFAYRSVPWSRAVELARNGQGGIISFSKTKDRLEIFDYSEEMFVDEVMLVTLADKTFPFQKITDLKGKRIGGILRASYGDEFEYGKSNLFHYIELIGFNNTEGQTNLLKSLLTGHIDAALIGTGQIGVEHAINNDPQMQIIANRFAALPTPLVKDPNYLAFSKDLKMTGFLREFNTALAAAQKRGEIRKIIESQLKQSSAGSKP